MPKISIIIPVYNVEKYIKQALDSLINQTLSDIEIICVNDCSTDNSLKILEYYSQKDNRIKIINLPRNSGAGIARNTALDIAHGKYIMFLDSDDWYELDACEVAYNQISQNQNDFVYFGINTFNNETGEIKYQSKYLTPFAKYFDNPSIKLCEIEKPDLHFGECVYKIYKKDFLDKNNIRFTSNRFAEDVLFYIKSVIFSQSVSIINKPLYNYRQHNNSSINSSNKWTDVLDVQKQTFELILNSGNYNKFILPYIEVYINRLIYWYDKFTIVDPTIRKDFYNQIRRLFTDWNKNYNIENIKQYINYKKFKRIIKNDYKKEILRVFIQSLFSIQNLGTTKILTIFGIKINLNRHLK